MSIPHKVKLEIRLHYLLPKYYHLIELSSSSTSLVLNVFASRNEKFETLSRKLQLFIDNDRKEEHIPHDPIVNELKKIKAWKSWVEVYKLWEDD